MTVLHLKSKTGPDGTVRLGDVSVGVSDADVDIVVTVKNAIRDEQWRKEMRELLDSMGDIHVEALPRRPMKIPGASSGRIPNLKIEN